MATIEEFALIENVDTRASVERKALWFGRELLVYGSRKYKDIDTLIAAVQEAADVL